MGLVRETLSVSTLGLISFRSKKEKLQRADGARAQAEAALEQEHGAREEAEIRVAAAEKRMKHATADAERSSRRLRRAQRRARRRAGIGHLLADAEPIAR